MTTEHLELNEIQGALREQIGGNHYKQLAIQPFEYNHANHLEAAEGEVIKYVTRHRWKNGKQDLDKAIHVLQMLILLEYPNEIS
jgi:hypothetical protein